MNYSTWMIITTYGVNAIPIIIVKIYTVTINNFLILSFFLIMKMNFITDYTVKSKIGMGRFIGLVRIGQLISIIIMKVRVMGGGILINESKILFIYRIIGMVVHLILMIILHLVFWVKIHIVKLKWHINLYANSLTLETCYKFHTTIIFHLNKTYIQ